MASKRPQQTRRKIALILPPRSEWLFQKAQVPEEELVASVCWEYLREVRTEDLPAQGLSGYAVELLVQYRSNPARRQFNDAFNGIPLRVLAYFADHPDFSLPLRCWQELTPELRRELNQPLLGAWPPLIRLDVAATSLTSWKLEIPNTGDNPSPRRWLEQAREVYAFAVANSARYHSGNQSQPPLHDALVVPRASEFKHENIAHDDPRQWLTASAANGFVTPAPFLINWAEYKPDEIVSAFRQWLEEVRPQFALGRRERGTSYSDLRKHLRALGASRIMQAMTEDDFKELEEYNLFREPPDEGKRRVKFTDMDLGKLRSAAVKYFQERFARDQEQRPQSWQEKRPRGKNRPR